MNRLGLVIWIFFLALGPVLKAAQGDSETKDELQGRWKLIQVEKEGKSHKVKPKTTEFFELKFKGNKVTTLFNEDRTEEGTYKIDPDKKPRTIDFMPMTSDDKGKTLLGIYEIKGDKLKVCVAEPEVKKRPTKFETKSEEIVVYVLERVKQ
jgi:uncharacterized protein (TIGR03067 family)